MREQDCVKLARSLIAKKKYREALKELGNLNTDEVQILKGLCFLDLGDIAQAK
jgi:hypothetical protein